MKQILILVNIFFLFSVLTTTTISYEQALKTAEHHLSVHEKTGYIISCYFKIIDPDEITLAYVFNLQPSGFVATSTDTDIYPVIGYSFLNNFSDLDIQQNVGYQYLKNDMTLRLEAIPLTSKGLKQSNQIMWTSHLNGSYEQIRNRDNIYPPPGYSPTEGWLDTQWHQGEPFNNFCPLDPGTMERSLVGCGATAFAQILHYHKYIGDVSFDNSDDYNSNYSNPGFTIDDDHLLYDFPSFPELNLHLDELKVVYENYDDPSENLLAALNFASGVSLELGYSSSGTFMGMPDVVDAFINKFGYDNAVLIWGDDQDLYDYLQTDMMEARPAYLCIQNLPSGHLVNCDGYNGNDDTFHLNMGWGGGSDGWYHLPDGMPAGYNTIYVTELNIEGGTIPFDVSGVVFGTGALLDETYITLDGSRFHGIFVDNPDGNFDIPILFPGEYEMTAAIELAGGGYFYQNEIVTLDEINNTLNIYLDNFELISGNVSAAVNSENTHINFYQEDILIRSGVADVNGDYTIPGLIPGDYVATASLNGNYFDTKDVTISLDNQIIDFQLEEYPYEYTFNFAGDPVGQLQLFQFMNCAIRLSGDELLGNEDNIFSQVEFIAPFDPDEGELYAQIWKNESLFYEQQIVDFTEGEWINVIYEDLFEIDVTAEYYIGYRIYSLSGNVAAAYHDAGPMAEGNGAYIYTTYWMELPDTYNYNFCINAVAVSQNTISNENLIPTKLKLNKNYPNPFNPETTISFSLNTEITENTELAIYNIKGQIVRNLTNGLTHQPTNRYSVTWNGTDDNNQPVSSGIYFYRLKTGNYNVTKKMILMK